MIEPSVFEIDKSTKLNQPKRTRVCVISFRTLVLPCFLDFAGINHKHHIRYRDACLCYVGCYDDLPHSRGRYIKCCALIVWWQHRMQCYDDISKVKYGRKRMIIGLNEKTDDYWIKWENGWLLDKMTGNRAECNTIRYISNVPWRIIRRYVKHCDVKLYFDLENKGIVLKRDGLYGLI